MRCALAAVLVIGLFGCKKREPSATTETKDAAMADSSADVAALRDEVLAKVQVFEGYPEYTPRDPALLAKLLDPSIESALRAQGTAPKYRAAMIEHAATGYYNKLLNDEVGIAAVEKMLTERYNKPVITRDGDVVRIDLGIIAGKPGRFRGGVSITSPFTEAGGHGLVTSEVVRNLELGMRAHPDAQTYQVEVDIPGRWQSDPGFTYVYDRREDRLRLYMPDKNKFYRSEILGGNLKAVKPGGWSVMEEQPLDRRPVRSKDLRRKPG